MFISKGSEKNAEPKNVILISAQKAHFAVPAYKQPGFMQRHIGPTVQICGSSGLPFAMVSGLHQCNVYIKRNLREFKAQKCNPSVQKAHFAVRACRQHSFMQRRIGPTVQICGNSGLLFAMVPCLQECNVNLKRKLRVCRAQKCNPCFGVKSPHRSTGLQTTRIYAAPYRTNCTNLP